VTNPDYNIFPEGAVAGGIQTYNEKLTIFGTGNTSVNGTLIHPLTVLGDDHFWQGPVALNESVTIDVPDGARLTLFGNVGTPTTPSSAALTSTSSAAAT
jgi:hypothetical protein